MNPVADKLDEARALIEKGWAQGSYALDEHGFQVDYKDPAAVCFFASAALWATGCDLDTRDLFKRVIGETIIPLWNDAEDRTQAEVIEAFRKAADLARSV